MIILRRPSHDYVAVVAWLRGGRRRIVWRSSRNKNDVQSESFWQDKQLLVRVIKHPSFPHKKARFKAGVVWTVFCLFAKVNREMTVSNLYGYVFALP